MRYTAILLLAIAALAQPCSFTAGLKYLFTKE